MSGSRSIGFPSVYAESKAFTGPTFNATKDAYYQRMQDLLVRLATERTGWAIFRSRWPYSDEPLRNDAANLLREMGVQPIHYIGEHLVGDDHPYVNPRAKEEIS